MKPSAPAISALTELGQIARPGRRESVDLLHSLLDPNGGSGAPAWQIAKVDRVPTLSFSGLATDSDRGLVRWPGSTPEQRRLTDLVVLRKDSCEIDRAFPMDVKAPTPSHLLAGSGPSLAVIRLRSLRKDHVRKMRTLWLDAFMLELVLNHEARGVARSVQELALTRERSAWAEIEDQFRTWRTAQFWDPSADHPMEDAIGKLVRCELGTDELTARVQREVEDHTSALTVLAGERVGRSVFLLTVATVLIPLLLFMAGNNGRELLDPWFLAAVLISVSVTVAALTRLSQRFSR